MRKNLLMLEIPSIVRCSRRCVWGASEDFALPVPFWPVRFENRGRWTCVSLGWLVWRGFYYCPWLQANSFCVSLDFLSQL